MGHQLLRGWLRLKQNLLAFLENLSLGRYRRGDCALFFICLQLEFTGSFQIVSKLWHKHCNWLLSWLEFHLFPNTLFYHCLISCSFLYYMFISQQTLIFRVIYHIFEHNVAVKNTICREPAVSTFDLPLCIFHEYKLQNFYITLGKQLIIRFQKCLVSIQRETTLRVINLTKYHTVSIRLLRYELDLEEVCACRVSWC